MKKRFNKIFHVLVYFFTPEDSERQISNGDIRFHIDCNSLDLGAAKAIFWLIATIVVFYLLTLL
ncbi:MAG: hypothetical protein KKC20_04345 [Proteobacteria bacterium]|nr:hypothetical protein [Pseudomonadota bacterium]